MRGHRGTRWIGIFWGKEERGFRDASRPPLHRKHNKHYIFLFICSRQGQVSVVAGFSVLIDIQAFFLDALVATQAVGLLDDVEENEGDNECEGCYRKSAKCLHSD